MGELLCIERLPRTNEFPARDNPWEVRKGLWSGLRVVHCGLFLDMAKGSNHHARVPQTRGERWRAATQSPKPAPLRLGREPETPPSRPTLWGIFSQLPQRGSKAPQLLVGWWLVQPPPPKVHTSLTLGMTPHGTQACQNTEWGQRETWLHRGLLPGEPKQRRTWGRGCSYIWVLEPRRGGGGGGNQGRPSRGRLRSQAQTS